MFLSDLVYDKPGTLSNGLLELLSKAQMSEDVLALHGASKGTSFMEEFFQHQLRGWLPSLKRSLY